MQQFNILLNSTQQPLFEEIVLKDFPIDINVLDKKEHKEWLGIWEYQIECTPQTLLLIGIDIGFMMQNVAEKRRKNGK